MRRPIYPDAEAFINFKKEEKYAKLQQETSGSNIGTRPTGKRDKNALPKKKRYSRREKKKRKERGEKKQNSCFFKYIHLDMQVLRYWWSFFNKKQTMP
ncbi:unnamed protein product [Rhizopus stolonifer]